MTLTHTIGVLTFRDPDTGARIGCIDVCADDDGVVFVRVNRRGAEIVMRLSKAQAAKVSDLLSEAVGEPLPWIHDDVAVVAPVKEDAANG